MLCSLALVLTFLTSATSAVAFQTSSTVLKKVDQASPTSVARPVAPTANAPGPANSAGTVARSEPVTAPVDEANSNASFHKYCGVLRGYSADKSMLELSDRTDSARTAMGRQSCEKGEVVEVEVRGQALKDGLTNWRSGDRIIATVSVSKSGAADATTLQDIQPQVLEIEPWAPAAALFSLPVFVILLTICFKKVRELLFVGQDGRSSNSKTQISLWFTLWVSAYFATFVLRWTSPQHFLGSISTPSALLALSGISGLTFAGAKGITANKVANTPQVAPSAGLPNGKRNNIKAAGSLGDLVKDDAGNYDFGDFQMLIMTLVAVVSYTIIAYHFLGVLEARVSVSLPDVDGTVLAMFGVGQGAYLAKKASTGIDQ